MYCVRMQPLYDFKVRLTGFVTEMKNKTGNWYPFRSLAYFFPVPLQCLHSCLPVPLQCLQSILPVALQWPHFLPFLSPLPLQ